MVYWTSSNSADPTRDFNADPAGVSLSTTAFLNARDKAQNLNVPFILQPATAYRIDQTIEFTEPVPIVSAGRQYPVVYSGSGSAFRFVLSGAYQFHDIRDLTILPAITGGGTHGIEVVLATAAASLGYFNWHRINVGPFALEGIILNNAVSAGQPDDGFYVGSLEDVFVHNGLKGISIGDSMVFTRVKVHGDRNVYLSGVLGQREVIWRDGQITTRGGFLELVNIGGFRSENMWYEHPSYLGDFTGSHEGASILLDNVTEAKFNGDTLGIHAPDRGPGNTAAHVIAMIGATVDVTLRDEVFLNKGWASHVYATSSTSRIKVSTIDNKFNGLTPVVVLQGAP